MQVVETNKKDTPVYSQLLEFIRIFIGTSERAFGIALPERLAQVLAHL